MTKIEKTFSSRSNAKRAIANFRDKNPDLTLIGVSVAPMADKFVVHATGRENTHVAAIDAAGFIRVEDEIVQKPTSGGSNTGLVEVSDEPDPVALPKAKRAKAAKAASPKAKGNGARKAAKPANGERGPTKSDQGLDMLRRKKGVTVAEMGEAFGWLPHTTRAWISATAGKKLGNAIESEVVEGRGRVYRIAG